MRFVVARALFVLPLLALGTLANAATVRVLVVCGQSNCVGRNADGATLPPELRLQTDALLWYEMGPSESTFDPAARIRSGGWIPLGCQPDDGSGTFAYADGFGPEITLGRLLTDSGTKPVAIVKMAINGTSLGEHWNEATGVLYPELIAEVHEALAALTGVGEDPEVSGFFWMQGEWDARDGALAAAYESHLTAFVAGVRRDLGAPGLPFLVGRVSSGIAEGGSYPGLDAVRTGQASVTGSDPLAVLVDTDDLPLDEDRLHFDSSGERLLGERFAYAITGIAPPGDLALDPPDPGRAEEVNVFTVRGASPSRKVYFLFGFSPGATNVPRCAGLEIGIGDPVIGGKRRADGLGVATLQRQVPRGVRGRTVFIQAVELQSCRASNLVEHAFP